MARKKVEAYANQRPFIMVFLDFLRSGILQSCYQKIVYIYLKLFADADGKCFPSVKRLAELTKISVNKVKSTICELIQLGLVSKEHRTRPDGGSDTNLYTINDSSETWGVEARSDGKRPFVKVYKDFLYNNQLDTCQQKLIYIYLGKFADAKQQCFPSIKKLSKAAKISISKVKSTINELREKGMISKENRWRKDGGKSSNLYTLLYNIKRKFNNGNSKEMDNDIDHTVGNEKGLDSTPAKVNNQTPPFNYNTNYTSSNPDDCQVGEKYSLDQIHKYFQYDILISDNLGRKEEIDAVMGILYDTLNTTRPVIMVNGDSKPSQVVISQLMKLNQWSIMYAVEQFKKQSGEQRIKNPKAYMRSILYNAVTGGYDLDLENQVSYNMAHWHESSDAPDDQKDA